MTRKTKPKAEEAPLDLDPMEGEADPFADSGGGDPFNFSEGDAPPPPKPAAAPPPAAQKAPPPPAAPSAGANPSKAGSGVSTAGLAADVPVQVVAVLGKKSLTVGELVSLKKGEVVELNRFPNEAVDLVANGKLMAKGELVEIDGKLGVRIIKIFE